MRVGVANSTGLWHCVARETGGLIHFYSVSWDKRGERWVTTRRGPFEWFPYWIDNGAYALWKLMNFEPFDVERYEREVLPVFFMNVEWALTNTQQPVAVIVPDCPGDWANTVRLFQKYAPELKAKGLSIALALQDGAEEADVLALTIKPDYLCQGGTDAFKWGELERWVRFAKREGHKFHVLRNNSPAKLYYLESLGVDSCDGTGWNMGDQRQTSGLEVFLRRNSHPYGGEIWPYFCSEKPVKGTGQTTLFMVAA